MLLPIVKYSSINVRGFYICFMSSFQRRRLSKRVRVMGFNVTFKNISVILWPSVLLVDETGAPGENYQPVASLTNFITWCWIELQKRQTKKTVCVYISTCISIKCSSCRNVKVGAMVTVMVSIVEVNHISGCTRVSRENPRPAASYWQTDHIMLYRVHLAWAGFELTTFMMI